MFCSPYGQRRGAPLSELLKRNSSNLRALINTVSPPNKKPAVAGSFYLAEREGFEPSIRGYRIHTFQACAFSHSATSPLVLLRTAFYFFAIPFECYALAREGWIHKRSFVYSPLRGALRASNLPPEDYRTLDTGLPLSMTWHTFQACAFSHSATSPLVLLRTAFYFFAIPFECYALAREGWIHKRSFVYSPLRGALRASNLPPEDYRTLDTGLPLSMTWHTFQACAFSHSATSPLVLLRTAFYFFAIPFECYALAREGWIHKRSFVYSPLRGALRASNLPPEDYRTLDTGLPLSMTWHTFQACAFSHSATSPLVLFVRILNLMVIQPAGEFNLSAWIAEGIFWRV